LGITNIRVIKRARAFVATLEQMLAGYDPEVLKLAASSVVLFTWSHDQPCDAPSLDFLKEKTPELYAGPQNEVQPKEAAWNSLLEAYGYPFANRVTDPDVREAFNARAAEVAEPRDLTAILSSIKDGWTDDAIDTLATASVDEYVEIFKNNSGPELRRLLSNGLQFDRISNATDQAKAIPNKIRDALKIIGNESPINARRVQRYGVNVAEPAQAPANSETGS